MFASAGMRRSPTICFPVKHEARLVTARLAVSLTSTAAETSPSTATYNVTTCSRLFVFFFLNPAEVETETGTSTSILRGTCLHLMGIEEMGVQYCRNPKSAVSPFSSLSTSNPATSGLRRTMNWQPQAMHTPLTAKDRFLIPRGHSLPITQVDLTNRESPCRLAERITEHLRGRGC